MDDIHDRDRIPDSEGDESDIVFWNPYACGFSKGAPSNTLRTSTAGQSSYATDTQLSLTSPPSEVSAIQSGTTHNQRSLRKRTAIQKMPYSLDRIRHKQLLQGFDVSNFNTISNDIELPASPTLDSFGDKIRQNSCHDNGDMTEGVCADDSSSSEHIEHSRHDEYSQDHSDVRYLPKLTLDHEVDSTPNKILFRGKLVDIKTGYRGVLPRIMWEKAIKTSSTEPRTRRTQKSNTTKGIAKRKTSSGNRKQDTELLDQLIASDDDLQGDTFNYNYRHDKQDTLNLQHITEYLDKRYSDTYLFDQLSDVENNYSEKAEAGDFMLGDDFKGPTDYLLTNYISSAQDDGLFQSDSNESGRDAREDNHSTIDAMLLKTTPRKLNSRQKTIEPSQKYSRQERQVTRFPKISKKSIRKDYFSNKHLSRLKNERTPNFSSPVQRNHRRNQILDDKGFDSIESQPTIQTQLKPKDSSGNVKDNIDERTSQNNLITRKPFISSHHEIARRPRTFTTVVEDVGHQLVLRRTKTPSGSLMREGLTGAEKEKDVFESFYAEAFDAYIFGRSIQSPDTIKITISKEQFVLSKFASDVEIGIKNVLNHIVFMGASDMELLTGSRSLVEFLNLLNKPELWETIDDYHKNFRARVNSLRERAKPIHFHQIAVCQVMLLQISNYSTCAPYLKQEIERKILDHTVSFFKLLSKCYDLVSKNNDRLLVEGIHILSAILIHLRQTSAFHERILNLSFPPRVALLLNNYFLEGKDDWNLVQPRNDYEDASHWVSFIKDATTVHKWTVNDQLVTNIYEYYKKRKFQDFEEEESSNSLPQIMNVKDMKLPETSIFNWFLCILHTTDLSSSAIEKMTPLSRINKLDSPSLLANRINLLLVLSSKTGASFEKNFDELFAPYFEDAERMLISEPILECMFKGFIALLELNSYKNLTSKGRCMLSFWKFAQRSNSTRIDNKWNMLLEYVISIFPHLQKSKSTLLRTFHPILYSILKDKRRIKSGLQLLNLYVENLHILGIPWVQSHLHQIISVSACDNVELLNLYCMITQFLADGKAITWWSVLNYININKNDPICLSFYTMVVTHCDKSSFQQIKHMLFETAVDLLLDHNNASLRNYLIALSKRDDKFSVNFYGASSVGHFETITKSLVGFHKASYDDLIEICIANIKTAYSLHPHKRQLYQEIIAFINSNFVDKVKKNHDFLYLKRQFEISDEETDKSIFRDLLKSLGDDSMRAVFIQEEIMRSNRNNENSELFIEKLSSSLGTGTFNNDFEFFTKMIEANTVINANNQTSLQWLVLATLIKIINRALAKRYYQVTSSEFYEICKLHRLICHCYCVRVIRNSSDCNQLSFFKEACNLQIWTLKMSRGFLEHSLLMDFTGEFLSYDGSSFKSKLNYSFIRPIAVFLEENKSYHVYRSIDNDRVAQFLRDQIEHLTLKLSRHE
ncbi:LAFE_0D02498g1_1 [Lachancea fermentati]|uniref:LAFE_0D02498g1_1 n=1 Tax=Lachancea fermentati TaxID=4955 RepID=A0A1G4MAQ9_LACFM|nr:LAFE_0D02498g1_1 [Lachancea fermentati]